MKGDSTFNFSLKIQLKYIKFGCTNDKSLNYAVCITKVFILGGF